MVLIQIRNFWFMLLTDRGIGLALASRLIENDSGIRVCLACRNINRAQAACELLLKRFPQADVTTLQLDVSSPASVYQAAGDIQTRL